MKKNKINHEDMDDSLDLDDGDELEKLFAATEPANRPPVSPKSQRKGHWRSVEEYMEARRLQGELLDDYLLEGEEE